MAIGDIARVELRMSQFGQRYLNVWHFRDKTGTASLFDLLGNINGVVIDGPAGYKTIASSALTFESLRGVKLIPYGEEQVRNSGVAGTRAASAEVATTAAIMAFSCGTAIRSERGRMFAPGLLAADTSSGLLTSTYLTLANTFCNAFAARFVDGVDWDIGIFSRKHGGTKPPFLSAGFTAMTSITPVTIPGVLARRKVGRGG